MEEPDSCAGADGFATALRRLKQGIRDGFLAPYKVIKVHLDVDVEGWRPAAGELDQLGQQIENRIYNQKDFDRNLIIDTRTVRVAKWVSDYLKASGDRFQKTIVFCVDTAHAARMRQALINENADLVQQHPRYIMRITGDDAEGAAQLGNFIDPEARVPVIVTTSRLLSTGVDAQTCRLIVLEREVGRRRGPSSRRCWPSIRTKAWWAGWTTSSCWKSRRSTRWARRSS